MIDVGEDDIVVVEMSSLDLVQILSLFLQDIWKESKNRKSK